MSDIKKYNDSNDDNSFNEEREALLANFLGNVEKHQQEQNQNTELSRETSLTSLTVEDYDIIEIPDVVNEKVKQLNAVIKKLDNKPTIDIKIPDKKFKINYIRELNKSQLAASTYINGPLLVIAGAGSGKTRVIVHRLSFLLELGVDPQEILLLTFTKKAAKEMLNRAEKLLQSQLAGKVMGGTFHSFANYTLRKHCNLLGLPNNFTIMDTPDSEDTIDLIRTELKFAQNDKAFPKKKRIHEIISSSRNRNLSIKEVIEKEFTGLLKYEKDIELIMRGYTQYKKICAVFDYDDLLEHLRDGLRDNLIFRNKIQEDYRYIMVDEFQDTNIVQKEIIDFIAEKHRNIMIVGDDAQSIYSFRGANYENILRFPETYPECAVVKIEQNYRSNQTLLNFTNAIIKNAKIGYKKRLFSENTNNNIPIVQKFYNQEEEAEFIVSRILSLRERGIELKNMAVLCRAAWHWHIIEFELQKRGIPYVTVGGLAFHEKLHIKDIVSYLRLTQNPYDAVAWHRILKLLPGIGKITATNIVKEIRQNNGLISAEKFEKKNFYSSLKLLADMLMSASDPTISVASKVELIKNYYYPILKSRESDYQSRMIDINVLNDMAGKYDTLEKFLSDFTLEPPSNKFSDKPNPMVDESEEKPLTLSTVHSAKGLEWYAIFVPHTLDGLFPSSKALTNIEDIEEERRLFYVACSRAKEELYITMPSYVKTFNGVCSFPSRFLVEVARETYKYNS